MRRSSTRPPLPQLHHNSCRRRERKEAESDLCLRCHNLRTYLFFSRVRSLNATSLLRFSAALGLSGQYVFFYEELPLTFDKRRKTNDLMLWSRLLSLDSVLSLTVSYEYWTTIVWWLYPPCAWCWIPLVSLFHPRAYQLFVNFEVSSRQIYFFSIVEKPADNV